MHRLLHTVITLLLYTGALVAQPGLSSFVHYTTDHGLSNDHVRDILKDQQGFLWVATQNGLNRFDGHRFRRFFHEPDNDQSLPGNEVHFLTLAPDGGLWAAGNRGLCRIDPLTLDIRRFLLPEQMDDRSDNDQVGQVVFDQFGRGWVCGQDALYCFDPPSWEWSAYPLATPGAGLFSSYYDGEGRIWLIVRGIISYFEIETGCFRTLPTDTPGNPLADAAPLFACRDPAGKLWVSTWFRGLAWYDPVLDSLIDFPDGHALTTVIRPDRSPSGASLLWLGGGQSGLFLFNPESGEAIQFPPDPRDPFTHNNYIATALYKDEQIGSLWIGTEAGLEHYSPVAMRFDRVILPIDVGFGQFSLVSDVVLDRTDPSEQNYFIAMWGSGLLEWNRGSHRFRHMHRDNSGLRDNGIFCAVQDRSGQLWLGAEGVTRYDPRTGSWQHYDCFAPGVGAKVKVMSGLEHPDGSLWFGTNYGGLFRYDPSKDAMVPFELPAAAYGDHQRLRINNMALDGDGRIWMATYHRPLRLDPRTGEVEVVTLPNAPESNHQWTDVLVSASGLLYATSHDALLELDDRGTVLRRFDQRNGLRSNQVYYVEEDRRGQLWINTNYLLHCLEPATGRFTYYGTADGLFKNTMTDALVTLPNGELFIGFQNAFNYIDPGRLKRNHNPPPVVITAVRVMDEERRPQVRPTGRFRQLFSFAERLPPDTAIVLRPGDKMLTLDFAALNFNQPSRNRYAYQLEGFSEDWVYTDINFATFTNLAGGDYRFRVKAANNDGVWNNTGTLINIRVVPPFQQRWYFYLLVSGALGLLLFFVSRYRHQQRRRLASFRESLARDLHDEMGSTLSSIRFFSEYAHTQLNKDQVQLSSILQRIMLSATTLSESMQDIVWAMRQNNDQLEDLSARMTQFGLRIFEAKNVDFQVRIEDGFSGKSLSPELRRNLYLIFKEAVNNAAKYADATAVELELSLKKEHLLMKISDNGKGIDKTHFPSEGKGGNGLENMKRRASDIGGELTVLSDTGQGTKIILQIPL